MLNMEALAYQLLRAAAPDAHVQPELDVESLGVDELPAITFQVTGGEAIALGVTPPSAWDGTLAINIIDDDLDDALELARSLYDSIWGWDDPWNGTGVIAELGHVAEVADQSLFTRVGSADVGDRTLTHIAGSFTMQFHKA